MIGDVRGRGAMLAIEFVKPGTAEPDPDLTKAVAAEALAQGVMLLTCGTYGNVIRLLPPLVIRDDLLDEGTHRARGRAAREGGHRMTNATALLDSLPTDLWIGRVQARAADRTHLRGAQPRHRRSTRSRWPTRPRPMAPAR